VAAVGFAAGASAEMVGGGEDEVRAIHVEVFGAERLGCWLGIWSWVVELEVAHEKRPG